MYIKDIEEACRRVLSGDKKALTKLGLDNVTYPVPKPQNTSTLSLQTTYDGILNTAVAARELQLSFVEKQCELTLQYIQAIAAAKKIKLLHQVDGQDVAEMMLALIDQEKQKYWHQDRAAEGSASEEGEAKETSEIKETEEESRVEEETEDDTELQSEEKEGKKAQSKKRKAVIQIPEEMESEESEEERLEEEETEPQSEEESMESQSEEEVKLAHPKKRKAVIQMPEETESEESEEESQGEEEESESSESEEEKKEEKKEAPAGKKKEKRKSSCSHHLSRKCVVGHHCSYEGPNLKRHLMNVHVKRKHIDENQVDRLFAMGLDGKRKRGPSLKTKTGKKTKGRWKRWCPEPDCCYLGPYLAEHLQNKHHMKPRSSKYKTSLKIAVRYKGLQEELENITKPSSPAPPKRPYVHDSEDDVIPPTPVKPQPKSDAKALPKQVMDTSTATPEQISLPGPSTSKAMKSVSSSNPTSDVGESDEDEGVYMMAADYFNEKEPKSNRHKWMCFFYRYLFTPSSGFHKDKNRLQHACQVKRILEETDPSGNDIVFLAEEEGNRVWVDWVIPNLKKKKPGTLKSYLTSFEIFLEYVVKKGKRPHLPQIDVDVSNQLFDLFNSLKKWRRCITKETASAKWDRYLDESDRLLTTAEVEDILSSKPAVDGRAALLAAAKADDIESLSIAKYCEARDFLIVSLTRAIGTRPAPLENATLQMFEKANWDDQKRKKVMLVSSHKREEDGPAPIPMCPDTEYLMNIFINKLRPLVTDDTSPTAKIFLKADGAPFQKGTIGRRVRAFVVKSGIRPDKTISATDFRKWIVTEMKRKKRMGIPIDEELLRRLMCHSDKTANEWYLRESLTEEAAEASILIEKHTTASKEDPKASSSLSSSRQQPIDDRPLSKEKSAQVLSEDITQGKDDSVNSAPSGSSSKTSLSVAQHKQIEKVFAKDLESGIEPRRKRIVALMRSDPVLRVLVNSQLLIKKVTDRVRYLFENRTVVDPFQLPEENPTKRTAEFVANIPEKPPSTIESGRVEWSTEETEAIRQAITFWKKVPTRDEIRQKFNETQVLRDIFRSNTFERIRNKVKNEYRKMFK